MKLNQGSGRLGPLGPLGLQGLQNAYRTSQPVSDVVHRIEVVRGHRWMPWPLSVDMSVDDALHLQQSPCTTYLYSRARQLARQSFILAQLWRFANPWHAARSDHTALHGLRRISSIGGSHTGISFPDRARALLLLPLFNFPGKPHCAGTVLLTCAPRS